MAPVLYSRLASWWPLLSAPWEYEEEAAAYAEILRSSCSQPPVTVLELGSGGGNNASHLKRHFRMTLTDLSAEMLAVSQALNPECEHIRGDMRSLRISRVFDAVFVQDAIGYMTTRTDLLLAMRTAFVHCRPGGAALFIPDYTRETFRSATCHGGHDGPDRSLRYLQWDHAPDPDASTYRVDFAFLLREASGEVSLERDAHECGLFTVEVWRSALQEAGFEPDSMTLETEYLETGFYRVLIGRKPVRDGH